LGTLQEREKDLIFSETGCKRKERNILVIVALKENIGNASFLNGLHLVLKWEIHGIKEKYYF
jgi:hypothetical protein